MHYLLARERIQAKRENIIRSKKMRTEYSLNYYSACLGVTYFLKNIFLYFLVYCARFWPPSSESSHCRNRVTVIKILLANGRISSAIIFRRWWFFRTNQITKNIFEFSFSWKIISLKIFYVETNKTGNWLIGLGVKL
jgi:hypothetical protein